MTWNIFKGIVINGGTFGFFFLFGYILFHKDRFFFWIPTAKSRLEKVEFMMSKALERNDVEQKAFLEKEWKNKFFLYTTGLIVNKENRIFFKKYMEFFVDEILWDDFRLLKDEVDYIVKREKIPVSFIKHKWRKFILIVFYGVAFYGLFLVIQDIDLLEGTLKVVNNRLFCLLLLFLISITILFFYELRKADAIKEYNQFVDKSMRKEREEPGSYEED